MNKNTAVHLALFTVTLIYAATFTIAKEVMPAYVKPFAFILLRVWIAAFLFLVFHSLYIREKLQQKKDLLYFLICGITGVAANMLFFFKGLSITTPINGSVLMMNTPVFVIVFAAMLGSEKLGKTKILGILLAACGAILLLAGRKLNFSTSTLAGDIYVSVNAVIYAYYLVYAKPLMERYHPITVTLYSFLFGAILVLPFGFGEFSEIEWSTFPSTIWWMIIFITFGSTFITYLLNAWALKNAASSLVGSYIYLQPVLATLIAVSLGKDFLSIEKALFIGLIFLGVYLVGKR